MKITTLRFFNVFGPRQDIHRKNPPLLNYLVREVKGGNAPVLHSDGKQQRDYIHVDDVVRLVDICLDKKPNDTFNVCTGTLISVNQIVEYVCDVFNSDIKMIMEIGERLENGGVNTLFISKFLSLPA